MASGYRNPRVFFDIEIDKKTIGRVIFELFADIVPKTAENFRVLCTGVQKPLHFKGSSFHRVIKGFMLQGGDFTRRDGTGGESIYGPKFEDESFQLCHDTAGLLSMANAGKNTNGSQFFITLVPCPHLDGKHVVFGRVIDGMEVVDIVSETVTDKNDRPYANVMIANCGELQLLSAATAISVPSQVAPGKRSRSSSSSPSSSSSEEEDDGGCRHCL